MMTRSSDKHKTGPTWTVRRGLKDETVNENNQEVRYIPLSGKHGRGKFAIVDADDYEWLSRYKWRLDLCGYALRSTGSRTISLMHREIMDAPKGTVLDHINRDKLDNRKINLRFCTIGENNCNSQKRPGRSKYRGVSWRPPVPEKWRATLKAAGKNYFLGSFLTEEEAARAYDEAAKKYHGEFASLNFPDK